MHFKRFDTSLVVFKKQYLLLNTPNDSRPRNTNYQCQVIRASRHVSHIASSIHSNEGVERYSASFLQNRVTVGPRRSVAAGTI